MNKVIFFIWFFVFSFVISPLVSANLLDGPNGNEEDFCFQLLNTAISQDSRFNDGDIFPEGDLSKVLFDESNNSYNDLSKFSNFWNSAAKNPANSGYPNTDDYYFQARRNNIGTIIAGNNYVISQISGFGRDSNFDFPLESKSGYPYGDKYKFNGNFFKEYVLYTHHVNSYSEDYPLMSCGIVKVIPLGGRTFSDINESGYMTNILNGLEKQENLGDQKCASGFEGQKKSSGSEKYYNMKANICVQSYDESDYLKLEVISIAYDNSSTRINEYYTNQLQVEAMRDNSNHANGLKGIQDVFRQKLENETCYSVVHGSKYSSNFPVRCNGEYGPISYQTKSFSISDILFPKTYARDEINTTKQIFEEEEDTGMMVYDDLPYVLYKKLEAIPDESFKEYMLLSVLPNFEELIQHRVENDILLTPFEDTFSSCGLDYNQRLDVVTDFLENLNIENFSLSQLQYSNESYGDCIIPYPDMDKISMVVEGSFESNKLLAEKLSGNYIIDEDSEKINAYIEKREALLAELNKNLKDIESRFNKGEIDIDQVEVLKIIEQEKFQGEIDKNNLELDTTGIYNQDIIPSDEGTKITYSVLLLILLLLVFGGSLIGFVIYRKYKK